MTDLELYVHFNKYVFEVHEDGICFIIPSNYENFVLELPLIDSERGFKAYVTSDGYLCFNIDDVSHFFDDFETFKEIFLKECGV